MTAPAGNALEAWEAANPSLPGGWPATRIPLRISFNIEHDTHVVMIRDRENPILVDPEAFEAVMVEAGFVRRLLSPPRDMEQIRAELESKMREAFDERDCLSSVPESGPVSVPWES